MNQIDIYESILEDAEMGNPHSMLKVAKLYRIGVFGDTDFDEYIYWLKRFFTTPEVESLILELEEQYSDEDSEEKPIYDLPFPESLQLRNDIAEAGLALGLYYRNSCKIEDLVLAEQSLSSALDALAWGFLEYDEKDGTKTDILSILEKIHERKGIIESNAGTINE